MENATLEKNEETVIKFGGFYGSRFGDEIDYWIERDIEEGYYDSWEKVDFPMTYQNYIENYCNELRNFIFQEFDLNINFDKVNLWSPREYNFRTDEILCEISKKQVNKLNKALADFEKAANAELKTLDPKSKPIKVDRYKI